MGRKYIIDDPEILDQVRIWHKNGYSLSDIQEKLRTQYGIEISLTAVRNAIMRPISGPVDEQFLRKLTEAESEKIERIVKNLKEIIDMIDTAKSQVQKWFDRLSKDLEEIYHREKEKGLSLNKIIAIKESLKQDIDLLSAYSREFTRFRDIFLKLIEATKPKEISINKLDLYLQLSQIVEKIEKEFNVYWIQPVDKDAEKVLNELIKSGRFKLYSQKKKVKKVAV